MKEDKMKCPADCHHHAHMANWYMLLGVVAVVYGTVMWVHTVYAWAPYTGWMVGGVVLIIFGIVKKMWGMKMM